MIAALLLATLVAAASPPPAPGAPIEEDVHQNSLVGEFARPPDPGRHAAVIVLGGLNGGVPDGAFDFARLGYSTLALAYFGAGPLPNDAAQAVRQGRKFAGRHDSGQDDHAEGEAGEQPRPVAHQSAHGQANRPRSTLRNRAASPLVFSSRRIPL